MATFRVPSLVALPRISKSGAVHACICGCGQPTKSTWHSGCDGRATGWALRIEGGYMTLDQVPDYNRAGAEYMLLKRKAEREEMAKFLAKKQG